MSPTSPAHIAADLTSADGMASPASGLSSSSSQRWKKRSLASWLSGSGRREEEKASGKREKVPRSKSKPRIKAKTGAAAAAAAAAGTAEEAPEGFFISLFRKKEVAVAAAAKPPPPMRVPVARRPGEVPPCWGGAWAGIEGRDGYTRFPLGVERAVYRLSHFKLANPRRPMRNQVLVSNFMYSYLATVAATEDAAVICPSYYRPGPGPDAARSPATADVLPERYYNQPYALEEAYWHGEYVDQPQNAPATLHKTDSPAPAMGYGCAYEHVDSVSHTYSEPACEPEPEPEHELTGVPAHAPALQLQILPCFQPQPEPQPPSLPLQPARPRSSRRNAWKTAPRTHTSTRPGLVRTTSSRSVAAAHLPVTRPLLPQFSPEHSDSKWDY